MIEEKIHEFLNRDTVKNQNNDNEFRPAEITLDELRWFWGNFNEELYLKIKSIKNGK